ncbi:hypothetical protein IQ260_19770 [Leptolyngbya cf. ectocarpi LEGE 11479]|uniref:Uncharacterized protein n=1 Tax=Leptolyngbya cf. ectocarpi LEGE 11479 TaxID=1828722 RepID=A0A929F8M0_LEPEC|nr:hypothetical protein [Leptolyngbya ectocarpi]MBE9068886.1 hypothetical protein [Leptolyngbya cf. ectocarpi LEGE 11479]
MKKVPLLMGLMVFAAVAGGSFAYGWYSITPAPSPDGSEAVQEAAQTEGAVAEAFDEGPNPQSEEQFEASRLAISPDSLADRAPIAEQLSNLTRIDENGQITVALDELQLTQLMHEALLSQPQVAQIFAHAQSLSTTLDSDLIETGAVLNLSEIPIEGLPTELQTALTQLTSAAPMLAERDIYIGLVARPQVQDGQVYLDQDLKLKLGQFTLPVADVAGHLGLSTHDIEQRLNAVLTQQGFTLDAIEVIDERLVITGARP